MTAWIVIALLGAAAAGLLLREPLRTWKSHRARQAQERKRQWRKDRDAQKAQRSIDRAMNPAKAAARNGPPALSQVARLHGPKCWLCGTRTFDDDAARDRHGKERLGATYPVVDYVVSIDSGGTFELANARVAHRHCAGVRASRPAQTQFGRPPRTYPTNS